ncbi:Alpha_amylase [Hexamita inflata]|uniref:Alpha_amylase n=1 Tax=Hexamita inflata TaxID=28002 RepID=A0ABP1J4F6_9EUKA
MLLTVSSFAFPNPLEFCSRRIYQVLTDRFAGTNQNNCNDLYSYCGGNYIGLISKLDYIRNLGYNAIWISPTVEQAQNSNNAYHGYWFSNFYGTNPHFGSAQDLKNLINEAHKRDIWVIADVVYNHVGNCYGGYSTHSREVIYWSHSPIKGKTQVIFTTGLQIHLLKPTREYATQSLKEIAQMLTRITVSTFI